MARKSSNSFNMASEIRDLLKENPTFTGPEVYKALVKKFPNDEINESSSQVAFSTARGKLGLSPRKKTVAKAKRRGRPKGSVESKVIRKPSPAKSVSIEHLQAAQKFIAEVGDTATAIQAIHDLASLQIIS